MKKKLLIIATMLGLALFTSTGVMASEQYLGDAVYTNIAAYINHYPIPSYSFNGQTLIPAEALNDYGFDVYWNEYKRSLTITRNPQKTEIEPWVTFIATDNNIGVKYQKITTTDVSVFTGNYQYKAYGGIDGCTLINIEDLVCIDNVKVVWVPEVRAVKMWVEDGLKQLAEPWYARPIDHLSKYYDSCDFYDQDITYYYEWQGYDEYLTLSVALINDTDNLYCVCKNPKISITEVIDANGVSRKKPYSYQINKEYDTIGPSLLPYFYYYTDYAFATTAFITSDDLLPHTAAERGGLIKFTYSCDDGCWFKDEIRASRLPY